MLIKGHGYYSATAYTKKEDTCLPMYTCTSSLDCSMARRYMEG